MAQAGIHRAVCAGGTMMALGVPHTEVELIPVNGESADFGRQF